MSHSNDLQDKQFGRLTAIAYDCDSHWICRCECGTIRRVHRTALRNGRTRSCGCLNLESRFSRHIDITGQRFGKLTAIKIAGHCPGKSGPLWECLCDCGQTAQSTVSVLRSGQKQSCGCLFRLNRTSMGERTPTTHKMSKHPLYATWRNMMNRCYNKSCKSYRNYGARGIQVCPQWHSVAVFIQDMGDRPKGTTLERRNNNGNYDPENCEWATPTVQVRNRSITKLVTLNGITKPLSEWCEQYGIDYKVVHARLGRYRWPLEKALTTPPMSASEAGLNGKKKQLRLKL